MCRKRVLAAGSELATVKSSFSSPRRWIYRVSPSVPIHMEGFMRAYQLQGRFRRRPQSSRAILQQNCTAPYIDPVGTEPSAKAVRTLYQSDFGRRMLSREVVSGRESRYPSSEDGYVRFLSPAEPSCLRRVWYGSKNYTHVFRFADVATCL